MGHLVRPFCGVAVRNGDCIDHNPQVTFPSYLRALNTADCHEQDRWTDGLCFPEADLLETANFFTKETEFASARRAGDSIEEEAGGKHISLSFLLLIISHLLLGSEMTKFFLSLLVL